VLQNGGDVGIWFPATNPSGRIWARGAMNLSLVLTANSVELFPPLPMRLRLNSLGML
jgi:hypothetical protein